MVVLGGGAVSYERGTPVAGVDEGMAHLAWPSWRGFISHNALIKWF